MNIQYRKLQFQNGDLIKVEVIKLQVMEAMMQSALL